METGVLAVYDLDENYTNKLIGYVSNKKGMPFRTIAFTKEESLFQYIENERIDILLISSKIMSESIEVLNIGKIIILSEGKIPSQYANYSFIFKYQSTENIIRELLDYYAEITIDNEVIMINKNKSKIIGVYSPIGGSGKTTFALTLGQIVASQSKALYINMEEFSAFNKIFEKEYSGDLSDLMYFYNQNPEAINIKVKAISQSLNELDYIPPLVFSQDLRNIESNEWIKLINKIGSTSEYEVIVLDLSNMVKDIFSILDVCDEIYMPINDDRMSLMKIAVFDEYLLRTEKEDILNKIVKVKVPESQGEKWNEDYFEQQLWGTLGDFIRKVLREERT